jgi:transcriptional regulator with XRE-family HTH domain
MLYATNESEAAVDASLASLREAVRDESPATAVAGAVTAVLARWRRLERDSPYRAGALAESSALLDSYCTGDPVRVRQLLPEREKLASTIARQALADQLREARSALGLSVRQAADRASVAASYLSELEGARTGLPSPDVAERLDAALGLTVTVLVSEARGAAERLRTERRKSVEDRGARPETDPRLVEAATTLRHDPSLLDLLDYARQLDAAERRAVVALMRELTA